MKKFIHILTIICVFYLNINAQIKPFQIGTTGIVPPNQGGVGSSNNFISNLSSSSIKNKTAVDRLVDWDFSSGLTGWTTSGSGTTWALSGNYLQSSGGGGASDYTNYDKYTYQFSFADVQVELINFISTVNATNAGEGIGIGIKSNDGVGDLLVKIDLSNTGTRGKILVYKIVSGVATLIVDSGVNLLSFTTNSDVLSLKIRRKGDGLVEAKAVNVTQGTSVEIFSTSTAGISYRSNSPAIWHFGGTQKISTVDLLNKQNKSPEVILVGNSITAGWGPTFINDVSNSYLWCGSGQTTTDLVASLDALANTGARYAILMIGMNDAGNSVSSANYMINIRKIVNTLAEVGTIPIICYVTPSDNGTRNGFIQAYNAALLAEYTGIYTIIDDYSILSSDGTLTGALSSSYDSGDGIHLNGSGYTLLTNTIESACFPFIKASPVLAGQINTFTKANGFSNPASGSGNLSSTTQLSVTMGAFNNATSTGGNALSVSNALYLTSNNASTGTVTNTRPAIIESGTSSGGGITTNFQGLTINEQTIYTGTIGIRSLISSGSSKWNLYCDGTASNYLNGQTGIGTNSIGSSWLTLGANSTSKAGITFTSGALTTSSNLLAGQMQFLTDDFYGTITTGPSAKKFLLSDAGQTSGRIPYATTNGRMTDDASLTYSSSTGLLTTNPLTTTSLIGSGSISSSSWTTAGIKIKLPAVRLTNTTSSGTVANIYNNVFGGDTLSASSSTTYTNAGTVFINPPVAGTNVTISNPKALILGGNLVFNSGSIQLSGSNTASINVTGAQILALNTNNTARLSFSATGIQSHAMDALSSGTTPFVTYTQPVHTGGAQPGFLWTGGAHTSQTTATEITDINWNLARVVKSVDGTISTQRAYRIQAPTYTPQTTALTLTDAATLEIGTITAGSGTTITRNWNTRFVGTGLVGIGGSLYIGSSAVQTAPTALLMLAAGTATANTAPLKFTSGTNLTTPEDGALEYNGTDLQLDVSTTRYILAKTLSGSGTLDFPSTLAGTVSELTINVTGAADGDPVDVGVPNGSMPSTGTFVAYVSSSGVVTVRYANNSLVTTQDPASGTFKVRVIK